MELTIRLQRSGKAANKRYNFRVVVIPKNASRDSRHLDILGFYDPSKKPETLDIDVAKVEKWVKNGAVMSDTVRSLVKKVKKTKKA